MKEQYWKYSLVILIVGLGILLFWQAQPFMNGILGGFTLYLLLRGFTKWLKTKIKPLVAVWIVTIGTTLFILIPLSLFSWAMVNQVSNLHFDTADIIRPARLDDIVLMMGVSDLIINLAVAIMLLFFMLWEGEKMEQFISDLMPFEENNKREVLQKIQLIVRSNAIGIPLLAIIQGFISLFGYLLCDAPNPVLTAMLTAFASIIPLVGTALVWVPVTAYFLIIGDWIHGLILLAYGGIIISQCDNLIRFILQKKMANIHPLITIFGVVAGLPIFGFMGIIFGPLLVSLFLLFLDMFRKEYLMDEHTDS